MLLYEEVNVNPKNRKTGDCSTRALVSCLDISYEEALRLQYEVAKKYCYGITDKQTMEKILKQFGYQKMKQPKKANGKKYLVKELDEVIDSDILENTNVFVTVASHHTCIKKGVLTDIWNCGNKTVCNYYIKDIYVHEKSRDALELAKCKKELCEMRLIEQEELQTQKDDEDDDRGIEY